MKLNSQLVNLVRVALFLFSIYSLFLEIQVLHGGIFTHGQVIDLKGGFPQIEFKTKTNQTISYKFNFKQSLLFNHKVGDKVDIIYDEKNPQEVVINNFLDKWFNLGIAILTGLLALFPPSHWSKIFDIF